MRTQDLAITIVLALSTGALSAQMSTAQPKVYFSDSSRLGRPFAKDPSVIKFEGSYWMYYSLPAAPDGSSGWGIGIAKSADLLHWAKVGELAPEQEIEKAGIAAPGARVVRDHVELFYQTYGKGKLDSICHAKSTDGLHFVHDPSNPVYRPTHMSWSVGRAIDAEVYPHGDQLWLFFATRDPAMKIQEIGMAAAPLDSNHGAGAWHDLSLNAPTLMPELPWEQTCIEAPSILKHGNLYYLFYAGAYNNAPQQIGVATSKDGVAWKRISTEPLLKNGPAGAWNSSESGHPGVFTDDNGRDFLFFQGNNDNGKTWFISMLEIRWKGNTPYLVAP